MQLDLDINELTLLSDILCYIKNNYVLPDGYDISLHSLISKVDNKLGE